MQVNRIHGYTIGSRTLYHERYTTANLRRIWAYSIGVLYCIEAELLRSDRSEPPLNSFSRNVIGRSKWSCCVYASPCTSINSLTGYEQDDDIRYQRIIVAESIRITSCWYRSSMRGSMCFTKRFDFQLKSMVLLTLRGVCQDDYQQRSGLGVICFLFFHVSMRVTYWLTGTVIVRASLWFLLIFSWIR